jgi:hypothetical protein
MSPNLQALFNDNAAATFERQLRLNELVGPDDWSADLDAGTLSFGDHHTFPIQILGTESEHSGTWLWAWANQSVDNPAILKTVTQLREQGQWREIPELTASQLDLDEVNGHTLGLAVTTLSGADAYYLGHYDGGAALMLLTAPELRAGDDSAPRLVSVFSQFISAFPADHRAALLGYLKAKNYLVTEKDGGIEATTGRGDTIVASFDGVGRLAEMKTRIG